MKVCWIKSLVCWNHILNLKWRTEIIINGNFKDQYLKSDGSNRNPNKNTFNVEFVILLLQLKKVVLMLAINVGFVFIRE